MIFTLKVQHKGKAMSHSFTEQEIALGTAYSEQKYLYELYEKLKNEIYKETK